MGQIGPQSAPEIGPADGAVEPIPAAHTMSVTDVVASVDADPEHGLTATQAEGRLARFGPNVLPSTKGPGVVRRMLEQFHNPLIYVLLVAGIVTTALGEYVDSAVILAVVLVNAIIGFVQESKAGVALESLRSMAEAEARVVRDGATHTMSSAGLVPGDLVHLEAGDKVPADLRLISATGLRMDESTLTGESEPVVKDLGVVPPAATVADRRNMT